MSYTDSKIGLEQENGADIGKNPSDMDLGELGSLGHSKQNLLRAIRGFCVECSGGSQSEARRCTAVHCQLWPYRMGRNPFRKVSEAQRRAFK